MGALPQQHWHAMPAADVLRALDADAGGLTAAQADARMAAHGPNELPSKPPPPFWWVFIRQFNSPLIYILAAAAVFSVAIGEFTDAGFVVAVMLVNAIIGSIQEAKAEKASSALQKLIVTRATVVRDGESLELPARELVPGDVVWLESGNRVPADIRLLSAHGLEADESLLTGESLAVSKNSAWVGHDRATLGDRRNMCHAGSVVVRGRGRGVVVATGGTTSVGALALDVTGREAGKPPLLVRMEKFTKFIGIAVLASAALVALLGVLIQNKSWGEMFMAAVALAVSAIPEGLPVTLTIVLAIATSRMARRGVVVRKLAAVEGLGSCTMIASDKTGTLTANELTVKLVMLPDGHEVEVSGVGYAPTGEVSGEVDPAFIRACVLCNEGTLHRAEDGWHWRGDPTDVALLALGQKAGVTREGLEAAHPLVNQIPFEPEHKYAATFHRDAGDTLCCVKGAPERVLDMCTWARKGGDPARQAMADAAAHLAARGFRVLGIADGHGQSVDQAAAPPEPKGLRFLGFVCMIDPLREGVKDAVAACRKAGITVAMVTGDHPVTALAIARELGMADARDQVLSGGEIEKLSPDELQQRIAVTRVFARTSPQQKLAIVNAARAAGHFVAVTGDGVNDAPALRVANIGVAMGKSGTDVAREAAELVISDDNFATIVAGVEEGRVAYDNLRKVIFLLVSCGAAEVVLVLLAVAAGYPLPLLPVQLLWLNLVTNGIQDKALALEPREGDVLDRKPKPPNERIFNRLMIERVLLSAAAMGVAGFALFKVLLDSGMEESMARNIVLALFVLFENVHIGNARSETRSLFTVSPLKNLWLVAAALGAFGLHFAAMHIPYMSNLLGASPLDLRTWATLAAIALGLLAVMEVHKLVHRILAQGPARA
ncbi:MAG: HAD-IC family P-type ATPase [Planctomycetes bacterium]|nr:HAD-IC family P-type ATPase [Planctomycetota bacterium]